MFDVCVRQKKKKKNFRMFSNSSRARVLRDTGATIKIKINEKLRCRKKKK